MSPPNPMIVAALGSLLRWALAIGAGYLVRLGIWETTEAELYVTTLAAALAFGGASLALSLWQKYRSRQTLLVALASPTPITEHDATVAVADGQAPTVTTPPTTIPVTTAPTP